MTPSAALADASGRSDALILGLVIPLLLAAIGLAVVAYRTYQRDRQRAVDRRDEAVHRQERRIVSRVPPVRPPPGSRVVIAEVAALGLSASEATRAPVPMPPQAAARLCPTCSREFRTALTRCPFDQTVLLVRAEVATKSGGQRDYLDTGRALMRCPACARRYDVGARHCLYDGEPLQSIDEVEQRAAYDGAMTCPACGLSFDDDASFCPDDGERLVPAERGEPGEDEPGYVAIPLRICPVCTTEYPATLRECPADGATLLPLAGRTTGGLPAQGIGPRTRICPECETRYADDAQYCAADGTELRSIN